MSYLHDSEFDFHFHRDHPFPSPPSILITGLGFHLLSSPAVGASAIIAFSYRGHVQATLEQVLDGGCGMGGVSSTDRYRTTPSLADPVHQPRGDELSLSLS
ncbi:hypothetical protein CEP52_000697 [Fusarium oligoseptatum]|uniref:Uncharacterized protein n=1 Tax=Fusarium oligoseptatum TaxID=2604345 RepID=A0A428UMY8_9HYPO|nr:hypothetical protein CEP52_000697 [Fusarium oligoseptatum]